MFNVRKILKMSLVFGAFLQSFALFSQVSFEPKEILIKSGTGLEIKGKETCRVVEDAFSQKKIYREVKVSKEHSQSLDVQYIPKDSFDVEVEVLSNSCEELGLSECEFLLSFKGFRKAFSGEVLVQDSNCLEDLECSYTIKVEAELEKYRFPGMAKETLEDSILPELLDTYPKMNLRTCQDLMAYDLLDKEECEDLRNFLVHDENPHYPCSLRNSEIQNSQCKGFWAAINFKNCEELSHPVARQKCSSVKDGILKKCNNNDFECKQSEKLFHGYLACMDPANDDIYPLCVGFQEAYIQGISSNWAQSLVSEAQKNAVMKSEDLSYTLKYIPKQRIEKLGKNNAVFLRNHFPTLSRSVLLNRPFQKALLPNKELWKEIEGYLEDNQTVGYELECPDFKMDISSGKNPSKLSYYLDRDYRPRMSELTSKEEQKKKILNLDELYKRSQALNLEYLKDVGVWHANKDWPYFDTYYESLFKSKKERLNFPLLSLTLESRFAYDHFPHIEAISAPLTKKSQPLNHKNIMDYMAKVLFESCGEDSKEDVHFEKFKEWKKKAESVPVRADGSGLDYSYEAQDYFDKSSISCLKHQRPHCFVQSNVGVFLDQLFTHVPLMQSIGSNSLYNADLIYQQAWNLSKKIFSGLQWEQNKDVVVDERNHAAGVFTYFLYELFMKAVLYTGGFDFWKGTIAHLLKYEMRELWKMLEKDEEVRLFVEAALVLWSQEKMPEEFSKVLSTLRYQLRNSHYSRPDLPWGEILNNSSDEEFQETVHAVFKEMVWTLALADDLAYAIAKRKEWGTVVPASKDLNYYDPYSKTYQKRKGFRNGDTDYSGHWGDQCDIAKTIRPQTISFHHDGQQHRRQYAVVETRYGNGDFNKALFWRCHEEDRNDTIGPSNYCK